MLINYSVNKTNFSKNLGRFLNLKPKFLIASLEI